MCIKTCARKYFSELAWQGKEEWTLSRMSRQATLGSLKGVVKDAGFRWNSFDLEDVLRQKQRLEDEEIGLEERKEALKRLR